MNKIIKLTAIALMGSIIMVDGLNAAGAPAQQGGGAAKVGCKACCNRVRTKLADAIRPAAQAQIDGGAARVEAARAAAPAAVAPDVGGAAPDVGVVGGAAQQGGRGRGGAAAPKAPTLDERLRKADEDATVARAAYVRDSLKPQLDADARRVAELKYNLLGTVKTIPGTALRYAIWAGFGIISGVTSRCMKVPQNAVDVAQTVNCFAAPSESVHYWDAVKGMAVPVAWAIACYAGSVAKDTVASICCCCSSRAKATPAPAPGAPVAGHRA